MHFITSKLPNVGTTIFTVMSQLAVEHNAINLGQGFPDFAMSSTLTDLVNKAMQDGGNQYVHMNGLPLLLERLAGKIEKLYNNIIDAGLQYGGKRCINSISAAGCYGYLRAGINDIVV